MKTLKILYADDEQTDLALFAVTVDRLDLDAWVYTIQSGEEVIAYLGGKGTYADRSLHAFPDLLVLDLRMFGLSGFDVFAWLKQEGFSSLPAVVLTGSADPKERQLARDAGAAAVFDKPMSLSGWQQLVRDIVEFGLKIRKA